MKIQETRIYQLNIHSQFKNHQYLWKGVRRETYQANETTKELWKDVQDFPLDFIKTTAWLYVNLKVWRVCNTTTNVLVHNFLKWNHLQICNK